MKKLFLPLALGRNKIVGLCLVLMSVLLLMGLPHAASAKPPNAASAKPPTYCVSVPEDPVTACIDYGTESWWLTTLSGVPEGYDVTNGTYLGWCVDWKTPMEARKCYPAMLYCSYDPDVPSYFQDEHWDMINYILNHKQGSKQDIQFAIWYFTDGRSPGQPLAQAMVDDALANGEGFIPGPDQVMAVLVDIEGQQRTIIEVDPSPGHSTGTPGYWKNHPEAWPVEEITIGGVTYTKDDAIAIMNTSGKGDKTYTMFRALVAAKLNVAMGNDSSCIEDTILAADARIATYGPVGSNVRAKDPAWQEGEPLYEDLDAYNNGLLCAPPRG